MCRRRRAATWQIARPGQEPLRKAKEGSSTKAARNVISSLPEWDNLNELFFHASGKAYTEGSHPQS